MRQIRAKIYVRCRCLKTDFQSWEADAIMVQEDGNDGVRRGLSDGFVYNKEGVVAYLFVLEEVSFVIFRGDSGFVDFVFNLNRESSLFLNLIRHPLGSKYLYFYASKHEYIYIYILLYT